MFSGKLLVTGDPNAPPSEMAWYRLLDEMGYECYLGSLAPVPASGLPWEDASLSSLIAGAQAAVLKLANFSAALGGLRIACTEGGWESAPWAAETGWGELNDLASQDVSALNVDVADSQALAYEALIQVLEQQDFFAGSYFWLFRADPTAGGASDNSAVVWGKRSAVAISEMWGGALTA